MDSEERSCADGRNCYRCERSDLNTNGFVVCGEEAFKMMTVEQAVRTVCWMFLDAKPREE